MLKALELTGFKSFADKTRFEFPSGITVVVGPNGSGKSNIVDAIKWVLGEQSARSLRGREMADIIFKGSGNGNRKPANMAEATIVFENTDGKFSIDATEIHVTRRVYRSGEGEYLINGQPCRLRDIKDLFRGTGVGADAYSLIEQGKVDTLLQASPKDRRAIFEEAAGISRFKAKKVETQRRLERVEQNLLRLNDIVEEVDHRLRRLKSQATKARRYQEYTQRLQALRTQVGRVDWQRLSDQLRATEVELTTLNNQVSHATDEIASFEAANVDLEQLQNNADESLRETENALARNRETITGSQATIKHEQTRVGDLDEQIARYRRQLLAMSARTGDLSSQLKNIETSLAAIGAEHAQHASHLETEHQRLVACTDQLENLRSQSEDERRRHVEQMRCIAELANQITAHESSIEASEAVIARCAKNLSKLAPAIDAATNQAATFDEQQHSLTQQCDDGGTRISKLRDELSAGQKHRIALQESLRELRERRVAAAERQALLEEFEARLEGIDTGVKKVLEESRQNPAGPYGGVRGIVADLLQVAPADKAPMVAVAMGQRAQHIVVAGSRLIDYLQSKQYKLPGRVGFMRLESTPPPSRFRDVDLRGQSGVIGRADDFVRADGEYQHLIAWLLADTWLVESLTDAFQFRQSIREPIRYVTSRGELLESDGRIFVGSFDGAMGVISRRAELHELAGRLSRLDEQIEKHRQNIVTADKSLREVEARIAELVKHHDETAQDLAEIRARGDAAREHVEQLTRQRDQSHAEQEAAKVEAVAKQEILAADLTRRAELDGLLAALEKTLDDNRGEVQTLETQRQQQEANVTAARILVAKSEQRVDVLQAQLDQIRRDHDERDKALTDTRDELRRLSDRRLASQRTSLAVTSRLAEQFLADETHSRRLATSFATRQQLRDDRVELNDKLNQLREQLSAAQQQQHLRELEAEKTRHERTTLAERLKDDYGLDIADIEVAMSAADDSEREDVDAEISELRRKLSNIGSVNMDALAELEDLEVRHQTLSTQFQDLVDAKQSLGRIIDKINTDSRRLFTETLEAIRANFSVLFRKVFGGGKADIVLEDDSDILEAGIDIVATPPGKQSLGLSLLSGGERALTAVTLLLAIFQYRPSPFCVLDEVDGPLDEANIGRFVDVLNEFLTWTKFVVVTHSKKTMTAAHTLYGVTMQESGVSKRVSVQFEDVSDEGEIRREALDRGSDASDGSDRGAA